MDKKIDSKKWFTLKISKILLAVTTLLLLIGLNHPTTLAYLFDVTSEVVNTFTPGEVTTEVEEDFDHDLKENVKIKNNGNVSAYIRAAIIVNWVDDEGNYAAEVPVLDEDYKIVINNTDWFEKDVEKDGYYYHKTPVDPDESTSVLIEHAKPISKKEGYQLSIEILGSGIQAMPDQAVIDAWGQEVFEEFESLGGGE